MHDVVIRGGEVLAGGEWSERELLVRHGLVSDGRPDGDVAVLDATGLRVVPGYIDLQCNGAVGIDLTSEPERLWEVAAVLPRWGVTTWLPTIVSSGAGTVERARATLGAGPPEGWRGAIPLGLHLEGPFLSPAKRGAHPEDVLRAPSLAAAAGWSRDAGIALVTLAPELPGSDSMIEALTRRGVVVSIGHSAATIDVARHAVDVGARWVTHLFNAMSPLHHREPGIVGLALTDDRVHVGLIADGVHVDPTVVSVVHRLVGVRLTLVTDAVAALGTSGRGERVGRLPVHVDDRSVRLPDGTLAGSVLSLDQAVRNLIAFTGCRAADAIHAATTAPATLLGDTDGGHLGTGARADVVLLDADLEVVATIVAGEVVHGADALR